MTNAPPHLVSPVAQRFAARALADRPASLDGMVVGLVDSMLNPRAMWGQGMLDAVERELRDRFPDVIFERVRRSPLKPPPPGQWAEAMSWRYAALVTAVGD